MSGGIDINSNDGVKVTFDPEDGSSGDATTVTVKDKAGTSTGGTVTVDGIESNDQVNINGSEDHDVSISGTGGEVVLNNNEAHGSVTNTATSGGETITIIQNGEVVETIGPGKTRVF